MKTVSLISAFAAGALLVAGCGEDRGATSTSTNPGTATTTTTTESSASGAAATEVGLKEWAIIVEAPSVGAGETKFEADNEGKVPHELVVLKTDTKADALKVEDGKAVEEGENLGEAEDIAPGDKKDFELTLEPGHYVLLCNLPGHYEQGMAADLDVQ